LGRFVDLREASDTGAHLDAHPEAVLLFHIQARVPDGVLCGYQRQLCEASGPAHELAIEVLGGIEMLDQAGELRVQALGRVALDGVRGAAALDQSIRVILERHSERIDGPHARHDDTAAPIHAHVLSTASRMLDTSAFSTESRATLIAFFTARASERP